jgi:hypothetical protein
MTQLTPTKQKSFYNKAFDNNNQCISYTTKIAEIIDNKLFIYGWYSLTSQKHLNAWLHLKGYKEMNKKQIVDYKN